MFDNEVAEARVQVDALYDALNVVDVDEWFESPVTRWILHSLKVDHMSLFAVWQANNYSSDRDDYYDRGKAAALNDLHEKLEQLRDEHTGADSDEDESPESGD